jgi:hypothetical protein
MRARDSPYGRQTQTSSTLRCREEGVEDAFEIVFTYAAAGVGNFDDGFFATILSFLPADANGNCSPLLNRFDRIDDQIQNRVFNLRGVCLKNDVFGRWPTL